MKNQYSTTWFEMFLQPIQPVQTEREVAFVARWLPQPAYTTVLDLCCGQGRHARALAARGYRVTGVDRSVERLMRRASNRAMKSFISSRICEIWPIYLVC